MWIQIDNYLTPRPWLQIAILVGFLTIVGITKWVTQ